MITLSWIQKESFWGIHSSFLLLSLFSFQIVHLIEIHCTLQCKFIICPEMKTTGEQGAHVFHPVTSLVVLKKLENQETDSRKNDSFVLLRKMFYCRIMCLLQFVTKLEEVSSHTVNEVLGKFRVKLHFILAWFRYSFISRMPLFRSSWQTRQRRLEGYRFKTPSHENKSFLRIIIPFCFRIRTFSPFPNQAENSKRV